MALEGLRGQRHAPAAIYARERLGTHCTEGWLGPTAGLDRCGKSRLHRDFFCPMVLLFSLVYVLHLFSRWATWDTVIEQLVLLHTYFILLARHYATFFRLSNNYLCLYQSSADLPVKTVPSINMYTFFHVCILLAVADYIPRTRCVPRSSFVHFPFAGKEAVSKGVPALLRAALQDHPLPV
jgi:hypothetical protein